MPGKSTGDVQSYRLKVDMSEKIAELEPNKAPLTVLTKKMKKTETANNPEYDWMEQELNAVWDAINNGAGYTDTDTALVVDNAGYFTVGDIVKVPRTAEVMLVTAIDTGTSTITVIRSYGATAAAALNDNDPLVIIGNANEEGAGIRDINVRDPIKLTNYTQIFRKPVGTTETMNATKTYGPKELAWQRHLMGIQHAVDMERAFLFGEKGKDTGPNGKPRRTTNGVLAYLDQNVLDVSGSTLTELDFIQWLEDLFRYGSDEKVLLASARLCTIIDMWSLGKLKTVPSDKTYGVAVKEYVSSHGKLYITKHHLLEGNEYGGYGIALDMDNLKYRPLNGRDTKLLTNRQNNDADEQKDEYLTEAGIELRLPKTHGIIKGVA